MNSASKDNLSHQELGAYCQRDLLSFLRRGVQEVYPIVSCPFYFQNA